MPLINHIVKNMIEEGSKFHITKINEEQCMCSLQPLDKISQRKLYYDLLKTTIKESKGVGVTTPVGVPLVGVPWLVPRLPPWFPEPHWFLTW